MVARKILCGIIVVILLLPACSSGAAREKEIAQETVDTVEEATPPLETSMPPGPTATSKQEDTDLVTNESSVTSSLEINPLCQNDFFTVVKGAKWIYRLTMFGGSPPTHKFLYLLNEIVEVLPDGFRIYGNSSDTGEFAPRTDALDRISKLPCPPQGLESVPEGSAMIWLPKELPVGASWESEGGDFKFTYTSMGVETITVPAGTFDAVKIKLELEHKDLGKSNIFTNSWYAPGVGQVKSYNEVSSTDWVLTELLSYSIPK